MIWEIPVSRSLQVRLAVMTELCSLLPFLVAQPVLVCLHLTSVMIFYKTLFPCFKFQFLATESKGISLWWALMTMWVISSPHIYIISRQRNMHKHLLSIWIWVRFTLLGAGISEVTQLFILWHLDVSWCHILWAKDGPKFIIQAVIRTKFKSQHLWWYQWCHHSDTIFFRKVPAVCLPLKMCVCVTECFKKRWCK